MTVLLQRMGPVTVVAAVFLWCVWPYVMDSTTAGGSDTGGSSMLTIPKALLSPVLRDDNDRNPFRSVEQMAQDLLKQQVPADGDPQVAKETKTQGVSTESTTGSVTSLVLQATMVQGERSMAVVGGKVLAPGDQLEVSDAPGKPWTVAKIYPEKVVLQRGTDTKTLEYPDPSAAPAGSTPENSQASNGREAGTGAEQSDHSSQGSSTGGLRDITSIGDLLHVLQQQKGSSEGSSTDAANSMSSVQALMRTLQKTQKPQE